MIIFICRLRIEYWDWNNVDCFILDLITHHSSDTRTTMNPWQSRGTNYADKEMIHQSSFAPSLRANSLSWSKECRASSPVGNIRAIQNSGKFLCDIFISPFFGTMSKLLADILNKGQKTTCLPRRHGTRYRDPTYLDRINRATSRSVNKTIPYSFFLRANGF